jgi:hypothetical protein
VRLKKVILLDDAGQAFVWITPIVHGNAENTRAQGR